MANSRQSIKRVRQANRRRVCNQVFRTLYRTVIKNARSNSNVEESGKIYLVMQSTLDKVARKGIIHPRKAARIKNRINQQIKKARLSESTNQV